MCFPLAKILSSFYFCPETLWETEIKDNDLINLLEEISKELNFLAVEQVLLATLARFAIRIRSKSQK